MSAVVELGAVPADERRNGNAAAPMSAGLAVERLGRGWRTAAGVVAGGMVALGVLGAVVSFASVRQAMEPSFGRLAWTVPIGVDLGIAVFTALDLILVRVGMRMRLLRLVPWALVSVTIYLNVASEDHLIGAVGHGVLPLLWVLAVEVVIHVMRGLAGLHADDETARDQRRARGRMDRVRLSRWLLAPASTVALWRRMKLWEERSYPQALARERDRVLARCDLQDTYGRWAWRWKAPRRQRALYRLGELAPTSHQTSETSTASSDGAPPAPSSERGSRNPDGGARPPRRRQGAARPTTRRAAGVEVDVEALLPRAREIAAAILARDEALTRDTLTAAWRADGGSLSNRNAGAVLRTLKAEGIG